MTRGALTLALLAATGLACENEQRPSSSGPSMPPAAPPASTPPPAVPPAAAPLPAAPLPVVPPPAVPTAAADLALASFAVRDVAPDDVLNIRSQPDSNSRLLGSIPPSATRIAGIGAATTVGATRWQRVRHGGTLGWVNARFLALDDSAPPEAPPVLATSKQSAVLAALTCFGTEPFWDIRFAPDGSASCGAMCEGPPGLRLANLRTNAQGEPESFELTSANRSIWLRAAMRKTGQCSDGMSDLLHLYEFEGVGAAGATFSGCCRNQRDAERGPRP